MASSFISLTINSGALVSNIADLRSGRSLFTLVANALTSCQLFLQVGTQANSAAMRRFDLMTLGVSSEWVWSVGVGDRAIGLPVAGPFLRLETSVIQADNRSLALIMGGL